jgi:hypothetical protein
MPEKGDKAHPSALRLRRRLTEFLGDVPQTVQDRAAADAAGGLEVVHVDEEYGRVHAQAQSGLTYELTFDEWGDL